MMYPFFKLEYTNNLLEKNEKSKNLLLNKWKINIQLNDERVF